MESLESFTTETQSPGGSKHIFRFLRTLVPLGLQLLTGHLTVATPGVAGEAGRQG